MADDYDILLKVVLVGDSGVGKSALLKRFANDEFEGQYISTIGVDFEIETIEIDDKKVRLQIWDTAGQERFQNITTSYYRGAHAIMCVYSVTDEDSYFHIKKWQQSIETYASRDVSCLLVGNKADLADERIVAYDAANQFAESIGWPEVIETSAKTGVAVDNAFHTLARNAVKAQREKRDEERKMNDSIKLHENESDESRQTDKGGCPCTLI